jgi:hypothetical protein
MINSNSTLTTQTDTTVYGGNIDQRKDAKANGQTSKQQVNTIANLA